jgi:hypothetical protein
MRVSKKYIAGGLNNIDRENAKFLFIINGKGKYGNGEPWDDYDRECARHLGMFIEKSSYANTPNYIDDTLVFHYNGNCYPSISKWRDEMNSVYDYWRKKRKKK